MSDLNVTHNAEQNRYEATKDGVLAGHADYTLTDELVVFTHTEVDPQFEGQGVGSALARFALDDVRADGQRKVVPQCAFIKGWIDRHPEYQSLQHNS